MLFVWSRYVFDGPARKSTSHRRRVRRRFDKDSMSNEEAWLREAAEYQERDAGLLREKKELRWGMVLVKVLLTTLWTPAEGHSASVGGGAWWARQRQACRRNGGHEDNYGERQG